MSNTLVASFCIEASGDTLSQGTPDLFETRQRSRFTSRKFTQILQDH